MCYALYPNAHQRIVNGKKKTLKFVIRVILLCKDTDDLW